MIVILVKSDPCYLVKSSTDVKKQLPRICGDQTQKQGYDVVYHDCPGNKSWYPNLAEINQFNLSKWDKEWSLQNFHDKVSVKLS